MQCASVLAAGATIYGLYVIMSYGRHEAYINWGARMRGLSLSDLACVTVFISFGGSGTTITYGVNLE